ncbi:MAG: Wadjet anti-phage system protein JetA family protein [Chthoniobacter sp.]|uniref:Wadjet anti-phage system protein JetA family protein n=1 Tax=Chthoniobacter sp. TaxID=2510640 RepID=UPI0032AC6112
MLGSKLFSELDPKFFGILTSPNARLYLDVIDAVEREMPSRGDALDHAEALAIIDGCVLTQTLLPEDEDGPCEQAQASSVIYRRLLAARWLEEEKHSDYRRTVFLDPAAQTLLEAFRNIVSQSIASFTGKLRLVCDRLADLRAPHSRAELIWEELKNCLAQVRSGLRELRLIRKQVERYARRQLQAATLAEALDLIYNEFSQLITQRCYRELIHARLPERLREAMAGLTELEQDDLALNRMREDFLRTETEPDAGRAMAEIVRTIEELSLALGDVEPTADRVDTSTADFARRSRSRIRYIQDVGSARRQQVKTIFDYVREHLPAARLTDLEEKLALPTPRLADSGLLGMASLRKRRESSERAPRRPVATELTDADREESLREMERNLRNSLRLDRANKFVDRLGMARGEKVRSVELPIHAEDDILDVISCLVFAPAGGANYRLVTDREANPAAPIGFDPKAGFDVERFELEKK